MPKIIFSPLLNKYGPEDQLKAEEKAHMDMYKQQNPVDPDILALAKSYKQDTMGGRNSLDAIQSMPMIAPKPDDNMSSDKKMQQVQQSLNEKAKQEALKRLKNQ